jgi:pimeloyl-ACP methyl ester carboxylesterase
MPGATAEAVPALTVNGLRVDMFERGGGRPLLFLHPGIGIDAAAPVIDLLAARARVIVPTHPGFGTSQLPKSFTTVDDLAYFYLDVLDALDLSGAVVVGVSFGAWIAAELAIKSTARLSHLVLANPVGIKVGDREARDIVDIYAITESEFLTLAYHDPAAGRRDYKTMAEADVLTAARNWEATARYGWSPYMHDPKLRGRLHRIRIPTLVLWGTSDRILSEHYARSYCDAIPGARFERIERAGHFPHVERPDAFAERVFDFVEGK